MLYNPSVAKNGDVYFSAHREDFGAAYQIYFARRTGDSYSAPERLDLGDIKHNRMDPSIDPDGRFLVYAGNEGDSLDSADIYIVFRKPDGSWGKPKHLPGEVNSRSLENAPALGRGFGEPDVSSSRRNKVKFSKPRDNFASLQKRLQPPRNDSRNIWLFEISDVLHARAIAR